MSGATCKTIICRLPALHAASGASLTLAALDAIEEAAEHVADLPGKDDQWMELAKAEEQAAAILIAADAEAAKILKTALAAVLP